MFVDIGANQGLFSLIAANQPMCKKVLAIEPVAATHDQLLRNIALNKVQNKVVPLEFAVSDRAGAYTMRRLKVHSGVATLEPHIATGDKGSISQPVPVKRIDELYPHIPDGLPVFVKINVAGHELIVLQQIAQSNFANRIIGLFCNQDDRWCETAQFEAALECAGFVGLQKYRRHRGSDYLAIPKSPHNEPSLDTTGEHADVLRRDNMFPLAI